MNTGSLKGWTIAYVVGSIPVLLFYAAGLSGWFYDYPIPLFISIFILFAIPLLLVLIKHPKAARWNIVMLWTTAILLSTRIIYGILDNRIHKDEHAHNNPEIVGVVLTLLGITIFSYGWTIIWARYFKKMTQD